MTQVKVALVGSGQIAWAHAYGWAAQAGVEIVGIADTHLPAAQQLARAYGLAPDRCATDFRHLLDVQTPDVVVITTWHAHHAEAVLACAVRDVPLVLCEKPMATSLGDAQRMLAACRQSGSRLAIGHQRRFYPGWAAARAAIRDGRVGTVQQAWTTVRDGLLNNGTHNIDLVRHLLGDPPARSVTGAIQRDTDRYERGCRAEDSAVAMIEFDGGARLFLESDIDPTIGISANALVTGSKGMLRVQENFVEVLGADGTGGWDRLSGCPLGTDSAPGIRRDPRLSRVHRLVPFFGPDNADEFARTFVAQAQTLLALLDEPPEAAASAADNGVRAIELVMAIYESARCHEVVRLPLRTRANPLDVMVETGGLPVKRPGRYDIRAGLVRSDEPDP